MSTDDELLERRKTQGIKNRRGQSMSEYEVAVEEAIKDIATSLDNKKHHILRLRDILEKQGETKSEIANIIAHSLQEYVS